MSGVIVGTGLPHLASNVPQAETEGKVGALVATSAAGGTATSAGAGAGAAGGGLDTKRATISTATSSSSSSSTTMTIQGSKLFLRLLSHTGDADASKVGIFRHFKQATLLLARSFNCYELRTPFPPPFLLILMTRSYLPSHQRLFSYLITIIPPLTPLTSHTPFTPFTPKAVSIGTARATLLTALSSSSSSSSSSSTTVYSNNRPPMTTTTRVLPTKQQLDKLMMTVVETAR